MTKSYNLARRRARLRAVFVPFITFIGFSTLALVLWLGGRLVASGSLTPGELISSWRSVIILRMRASA